MRSGLIYTAVAALCVSAVSADGSRRRSYDVPIAGAGASATAKSLSTPYSVATFADTFTTGFAPDYTGSDDDYGTEIDAYAYSDAEADGYDDYDDYNDHAYSYAYSESETEVTVDYDDYNYIYLDADAETDTDSYGDYYATAESDAFADGYITLFKKYWDRRNLNEDSRRRRNWNVPISEAATGASAKSLSTPYSVASLANTFSTGYAPDYTGSDDDYGTEIELDADADADADAYDDYEDYNDHAYSYAYSESETEVTVDYDDYNYIYLDADAETDTDSYGDYYATAESDAFADGYITLFKKYWDRR